MHRLLFAAILVSTPASAEVALFSQRDFQGARYGLETASSNMSFSPRSVRVAETPWELCPRPFFGGTCLKVKKNQPNLSLPRAFSGVVRSARPLNGSTPDQKMEEKAGEKVDEKAGKQAPEKD